MFLSEGHRNFDPNGGGSGEKKKKKHKKKRSPRSHFSDSMASDMSSDRPPDRGAPPVPSHALQDIFADENGEIVAPKGVMVGGID